MADEPNDGEKKDPLSDLPDRLASSKDERTRWEAQVATCMAFQEGNHRVWWDDEGTQHFKEIEDHEVWRTINLVPRALSVIVTRVTANDPRWYPKKSGLENVSRDEISAAAALLEDVWDGEELGDISMKKEMKLLIRNSFLQGGGLAYIYFDEDSEMPAMKHFELWDVYSDPSAQELRDKRWLAIALPKSLESIKENENYNKDVRDAIAIDQKLAESGIKDKHIQRITGSREHNVDTAMAYMMFEVEDGNIVHRVIVNSDAEGEDGEVGVLFKNTMEHPEGKPMTLATNFDIYQPVMRGRFYERPEVTDWIDPQKAINKIHSNIENYIDMFLQGRWLRTDENTEIPRAGVQGQIIDASPGELQNIELQPLPGTTFEYLNQNLIQFEQIAGVHSESMGRQSGSAESGVALAQLQALDEQNSSDAVDNFKSFMSRVGLKLLFQASMNWDKTKTLYKFDSKTGEETPLSVVGGNFSAERPGSIPDGTVNLRPFKKLDVEIIIGEFFSKAQKNERILSLAQTGYQFGANPIMDKVILDGLDIGIGREIVDELEALVNPEVMIAKGKGMKISEGERVEVTLNDPHQFLQNYYAKEAEVKLDEGDQNAATLLNAQAHRHSAHIQQGVGGVGSPDASVQ
jgi:hypothetical protein